MRRNQSATARSLILGLVWLSFAGNVAAQVPEDASAAYRRGDYVSAIRILETLAGQGNTSAQYNLGTMYASGEGVAQDYATAAKWYRLAALKGDPFAQTNLGLLYNEGLGVPQDYREAIKWYRLAADQGDAQAQTDLALMYAEGQGVAQDFVEAEKWFMVAVPRFAVTEVEGHAFATRNRDALAARMTPAQLEKARDLARGWKSR
jgi:TPR repeat protein